MNKDKKNVCIGLLAHVDAGKTTLSEALLYQAGVLKNPGRVDKGDAYLDTFAMEKERGITIFSKQAVFSWEDMQVTLLDTPGHIDFSAEMERTLQVLDYAVLVISGPDGVQGHTQTLWKLLEKYQIPVTVCASVKEAVADADIICTVTPSKEPLLTKEMVKPGTHINAVGTFTPTTREVSSDLVAAARLYSDQTEAAKRESGEYLIPLKEGLIKEDHIVGSIGEVLLGKAKGRTADDEITIFDALGLAIEDVASAKYVYERAAL